MPTTLPVTGSHACTIGALTFREQHTETTEEAEQFSVALNLAKSGTLTTRTDANTGTLTLGASHGILTGDVVDVYWYDTNGDLQVQHDVTVGTVAGTSVPIDSGTGTDLPIATTVVYVSKIVNVDLTSLAVTDLTAFAYALNKPGYIRFRDDNPATVLPTLLDDSTGNARVWLLSSGLDAPIVDPLTTCKASTVATSGTPYVTVAAAYLN